MVLGFDGALTDVRVLRYPVKLNNVPNQLVLDCGATVNAIEASLLNRIGGSIIGEAPGPLYYADERPAKVLGLAEVEVKAKGYREKLTFWVVEDLGFPGCFGRCWLNVWNPGVDWPTGELSFSDGVKWKAVASGKKEEKEEKEEEAKPMRLHALTRMCKKEKEQMWVCCVREVRDMKVRENEEEKEVEKKKDVGEKE